MTVYLTKTEKEMLLLLSKESRFHQNVLIREAIDQFLESKRIEKKSKKETLKAAAGLWADRDDLPDFAAFREEFDR